MKHSSYLMAEYPRRVLIVIHYYAGNALLAASA